jgi:hypothetical protein
LKTIQVPNRLTFETASQFGCALADMEIEHDHYMLDFNRVGRIEPFALLYLGSEIRRFYNRIGDSRLSV